MRLGLVALAFTGTARFESLDEASKQARVNAKGTDTKGRGRTSAQRRHCIGRSAP